MDRRIRNLERDALSGDPYAIELLNITKCRSFGHDWQTSQKVISTFPIKYKTVTVKCKRCQHPGDEPERKPTKTTPTSSIRQLIQRYAYGSLEELQREYQRLLDD